MALLDIAHSYRHTNRLYEHVWTYVSVFEHSHTLSKHKPLSIRTHILDLPLLGTTTPKLKARKHTHRHTQGQSGALINIILTTTGSLATSLPSLTQQHPLPASVHVGVHGDLTWAELGEGNEGC